MNDEECQFCLVNGPFDWSINDILLYNEPYKLVFEITTMRHTEFAEYKMSDHLVKIKLDNIYMPFSECVIYVINEFLSDYQKGQFAVQLQKSQYGLPNSENNQAFFFVLLNYSETTSNSLYYSQNLEIITEILDLGYKVFVLNVKTGEGRKELMEELILESQKVKQLRKKKEKKCLCVIN